MAGARCRSPRWRRRRGGAGAGLCWGVASGALPRPRWRWRWGGAGPCWGLSERSQLACVEGAAPNVTGGPTLPLFGLAAAAGVTDGEQQDRHGGGARQQHRDDGGAREAVVRGAPLVVAVAVVRGAPLIAPRSRLCDTRTILHTRSGTPHDGACSPLPCGTPLTTLHPLTRCPSRPTSAADDRILAALPHSLFRLLTLGRPLAARVLNFVGG